MSQLTQKGQPRKRAAGGGRPATGKPRRVTQPIVLSPDLVAWYKAQAGQEGISLSAYVERVLERHRIEALIV